MPDPDAAGPPPPNRRARATYLSVVPPGGLPVRVAEVTQALFEAAAGRPGLQLPAAYINQWDSPSATVQDTLSALLGARDAGLVHGPLWTPAARARELRGQLEEWFYST